MGHQASQGSQLGGLVSLKLELEPKPKPVLEPEDPELDY